MREGITRAIADGGSVLRISVKIANQPGSSKWSSGIFVRQPAGASRGRPSWPRASNGISKGRPWSAGLVRSTVSSLESPLPGTEDLSLGEVLESDSPTPEHFYAQ